MKSNLSPLQPFTEFYRLRSFSLTADGSFSYMWYDLRFLEIITADRTRYCVGSLDNNGKIRCHSGGPSRSVDGLLPALNEEAF